ncbi:MAG: GTPase ObgE [Christensenellales bacterium]
MFIDEVTIRIKAGDGGNGSVSLHREKYVPAGGADGGDGGNGGNVVFEVDKGIRTLMNFRYTKVFRAQNGGDGMSKKRKGSAGDDVVIKVPSGTVVKDAETKQVLLDMKEGRKVLLQGGRGGWGNTRFANSVRQTPKFARPGQKKTERKVILELKSIADVGLVGFPNVGKSTLLSMVSSARPKIADYPFTTLEPNLGVVNIPGAQFVLADIPGIIEGAHQGAGLGLRFLRHIERTRVIVHVLDISGSEGRDPADDYRKLNEELYKYSPKLSECPQIVAANKMDLPGAKENLDRFSAQLPGLPVFPISAATGQGVKELMTEAGRILSLQPDTEPFEEDYEEWAKESYQEGFEIKITGEGEFEVYGPTIDRLLDTTYPKDSDSMRRFQDILVKRGVIDALRGKGAKNGDLVTMGSTGFDFIE